MSTPKTARFAAVMMLTGLLGATAALAQTPQYSTVTLTEPTQVGDTVLPAGDYLIQVLPGFANRNRVQITDMNREKIHATLLTVPHAAGPNVEIPNTRLIFYPAMEGQPRALRTWFPPDPVDNQGHDIVYDERLARRLARAANTPVVTYQGTVVATEPVEPTFRIVTPEERFEPYVPPSARLTPVQTTTTTTTTQPRPTVQAETRTETRTTTRTELPRTASDLPLLALMGLISLAGAFVFRAVNQ